MLESLVKVAGRAPTNLLKKRLQYNVFYCEFWEIFKNTYFVERLHTFIAMFCLPRSIL